MTVEPSILCCNDPASLLDYDAAASIRQIAHWLMTRQPDDEEGAEYDELNLFKEALLSYRLIFGDPRSYKLLLKELESLTESGEEVDPFLRDLTHPIPEILKELFGGFAGCVWKLILPSNGKLIHKDLFPPYTQSDDQKTKKADVFCQKDVFRQKDVFPVYGSRLLAIQAYAGISAPWKDPRDFKPPWGLVVSLTILGLGIVSFSFSRTDKRG